MRQFVVVATIISLGATTLCGCPKPCVSTIPAQSETLIPHPRGGGAWDLRATPDGGFAVAGFQVSSPTSASAGSDDAYLIKLDSEFNVQWAHAYGGSKDEHVLSVDLAEDGGYLMAGVINSEVIAGRVLTGHPTILVLKADAEGEEIWTRTVRINVGANAAYAVCAGNDESFAVVGGAGVNILSNHLSAAFVMKFNAAGIEQWRREYRANATNATAATSTGDGGFSVAGYTDDVRVSVFQVNEDGDDLWTFYASDWGEFDDLILPTRIVRTRDGGYAVLCGVYNVDEMAVLKLDASGIPLWATRVSLESFTRGYGLSEAPDGSLVAAGETSPNPPPLDIRDCARCFAVRLAEDGRVMWKRALGGNFSSAAMAVAMRPDGTPVLAGYTLVNESYIPRAIYLLSTEPDR